MSNPKGTAAETALVNYLHARAALPRMGVPSFYAEASRPPQGIERRGRRDLAGGSDHRGQEPACLRDRRVARRDRG